jgi:hypothetical protein
MAAGPPWPILKRILTAVGTNILSQFSRFANLTLIFAEFTIETEIPTEGFAANRPWGTFSRQVPPFLLSRFLRLVR